MEYTDNSELFEKLDERLSRYTNHHRRKKAFIGYLANYFYCQGHDITPKEEVLRSNIGRLTDCGSYLLFKDYFQKKELRLTGANFCKMHNLCGLCAVRRAGKGAQNLHERAKHVLAEQEHLKSYYTVLTVKNESDLSYAMRKLIKGWNKVKWTIRDAKRARKTNNPERSKYSYALESEFANVVAGAWSIEVTFNEVTREWHPHMNLLLLSETEMKEWKVSQEWKQKTGDSYITNCEQKFPAEDKGVVCEIMKYALKFSDLPFEQNLELYLTLKGQRLKGTIGKFYGIDLDPDPADDELEGEPYIEILLSYYNDQYHQTNLRTGIKKDQREKIWVRSDLLPK